MWVCETDDFLSFRYFSSVCSENIYQSSGFLIHFIENHPNNTVCPTRYRARHFVSNFTTNEDIGTKFEADYRHIPLHFSHNERTPVQISLQYLHWYQNY